MFMMKSKIVDLQKYCQILEMRLRQGQFSFANTMVLEEGSSNNSRVHTKITN